MTSSSTAMPDGRSGPSPDQPSSDQPAPDQPAPDQLASDLRAGVDLVDAAHARIADVQLSLGQTLRDLRPAWSEPDLVAFCRVYPVFDCQIDTIGQSLEEIHSALVSRARSTAGAAISSPCAGPPPPPERRRQAHDPHTVETEFTALVGGIDAMAAARQDISVELTAIWQRLSAIRFPEHDRSETEQSEHGHPGTDQATTGHFRRTLTAAADLWTAAMAEMLRGVETMNRRTGGHDQSRPGPQRPGPAAQIPGRESKEASSRVPDQASAVGGVHRTGTAPSTPSRPSR